MTDPRVQRFCGGCRSWQPKAGHLCRALDSGQTVTVPLSALRALADDGRAMAGALDELMDGEPLAAQVTEQLIGGLGVEGL